MKETPKYVKYLNKNLKNLKIDKLRHNIRTL